jgi:Flp pilus assembly pilin Flp
MKAALNRLWTDETGGESVEWPFVIALLILALPPVLLLLKEQVIGALQAIAASVSGD